MDGLASYEVFKTGAILVVLFICFCISIGLAIYNYNKHYTSSSNCNIVNSNDGFFTQKATYVVNGQNYIKTIQPNVSRNSNSNIDTKNYANADGPCTAYYPDGFPNEVSINSNPFIVSEIIAGILFIIVFFGIIWFSFLRTHRNVAGVVGGIDVAQTVLGSFGRRRYY